MIVPIVSSPFAEIVPTCAISFLPFVGLLNFFSSSLPCLPYLDSETTYCRLTNANFASGGNGAGAGFCVPEGSGGGVWVCGGGVVCVCRFRDQP